MKLLQWFMVDVFFVLCQYSSGIDNRIISRQKRSHESDIITPRQEIVRKIKPVVIPVRHIRRYKNPNFKLNQDHIITNTSLQTNNDHIPLSPLERTINARNRIINALNQRHNSTDIENESSDINNTTIKEKITNTKEKIKDSNKRLLDALNPKNSLVSIENDNVLIKESNTFDDPKQQVNEIKHTSIKPKTLGKDIISLKEPILQTKEQNAAKRVNITKELNEMCAKVDDNKKEILNNKLVFLQKKGNNEVNSNTDKFNTSDKKNNKIKSETYWLTPSDKNERELIKHLLKQGKKSEVVTPNHYDRMYTKSLGPFLLMEKDRINRNKKTIQKLNTPDESKKVFDDTKNKPINTKMYAENPLKIEKFPSVAVLSNTKAKPASDDIKPEIIYEKKCKTDYSVKTLVVADNHTVEEPVSILKTGPSQEIMDSIKEPKDSNLLYIENQSINEIYESSNELPANYDASIPNFYSPTTEYTIYPQLSQQNEMYFDCNIPSTASVYSNPANYGTSNEVYKIPYGNKHTSYGNMPVNVNIDKLYRNQEYPPINLGNRRFFRSWKNTNVYFIKNGVSPSVMKPLVYAPVVQPLVTPNFYVSQN